MLKHRSNSWTLKFQKTEKVGVYRFDLRIVQSGIWKQFFFFFFLRPATCRNDLTSNANIIRIWISSKVPLLPTTFARTNRITRNGNNFVCIETRTEMVTELGNSLQKLLVRGDCNFNHSEWNGFHWECKNSPTFLISGTRSKRAIIVGRMWRP